MRLALAVLAFSAAAATAQDAATYRLTLDATWSAQTHPEDFPPDPHFSPVVGAVHDGSVELWAPGELATAGIEDMAETGRTGLLVGEVEAMIASGGAREALTGGWIPTSPGAVMLDIEVTASHPLVTLVSMLAPSPDWFVGSRGLDLRDGDGWVQRAEIPLYVWDAGTDSGASYTSPDADTDPAEPIARIEAPPFVVGGTLTAVGTLVAERLAPASGETGPDSDLALMIAPNPVRGSTTVTASGARPGDAFAILDAQGRMVRTGTMGTGDRARVDLSDLAPGVYWVHLATERGAVARPLIVAR